MHYTLSQLQAMPDEDLVPLCATGVMGDYEKKYDGGFYLCGTDEVMLPPSWNPLTNWNDTMMVLERVRESKGYEWHIFTPIAKSSLIPIMYENRKTQWYVGCGTCDGREAGHHVYHENPQRAIVIASILATQS